MTPFIALLRWNKTLLVASFAGLMLTTAHCLQSPSA